MENRNVNFFKTYPLKHNGKFNYLFWKSSLNLLVCFLLIKANTMLDHSCLIFDVCCCQWVIKLASSRSQEMTTFKEGHWTGGTTLDQDILSTTPATESTTRRKWQSSRMITKTEEVRELAKCRGVEWQLLLNQSKMNDFTFYFYLHRSKLFMVPCCFCQTVEMVI